MKFAESEAVVWKGVVDFGNLETGLRRTACPERASSSGRVEGARPQAAVFHQCANGVFHLLSAFLPLRPPRPLRLPLIFRSQENATTEDAEDAEVVLPEQKGELLG